MNEKIQYILNKVQQSNKFSEEEKDSIIKSLKDADKEISISAFKIERLEKVKYTTTVLLEQTIEELESKRKSVEQQKRELEIEAALERVRTKAMGMRKPDDMLDICRTIAEELRKLDVNEIRNVQTAIFYNEKGTYTNYEFYVKHDKTFITETEFRNHPVAEEFARQMTKGPNEFFSHGFTGKKVQEWLAYQKTTNVFIDSYLQTATSLDHYWYSLGPVALGLSTYKPLVEEEQQLFRRFRNVFELAYRRYLDIEKAELQAKESQIQLALERVRARTMAMQHSDELSETAYILFQQFRQLGEDPIQITIGIFNEEKNRIEFKITGGDGSGSKIDQTFHADINEPTLINKFFRAWKENKKSTVISLEGKELSQWIAYRNKISGEYAFETEVKSTDRRYAAVGFFSKGLLSISKIQTPSEETIQILERFASVFDLTYTRFLDLKNAEAQAKEAQIEAALEKIRSRSLAMHKSDELPAIAKTMFEQLRNLGLDLEDGLIITLFKENSHDQLQWPVLDGLDTNDMFLVPYFDDPVMNEVYKAREAGEKFIERHFDKTFKDAFVKKIFSITDYRVLPVEVQNKNFAGLCYHYSFAMEKFTGILRHSYNKEKYPEEENDILRRFTRVFEQAYVRFLDLQKAEGQAREARIETALERVRARAMAMQNSDELNELIGTVFAELTKLDLVLTRCVIIIYVGNEKGVRWWIANSETPSRPMNFFVKYADMPFFNEYYIGWQGRVLKWQYILEGENKIKTDDFLFQQTELSQLPDFVIAGMRAPERVYLNASFNNFGNLTLASLEPLSDEHFDILLRFAKVFDLTYTRFNDLKQAEAQAREAQVEASLERVRSRTLAMQKSEELSETSVVLFKQLINLGIEPNRLYICIIKDNEANAEFWITDEDGSKVSSGFEANLNQNGSFKKMLEGWKLQKISLTIDMQGTELEEYFTHLSSLNVPFKGGLSQQRRVQNISYFSKGFIGIASPNEQPEETIQLLDRFASVFNLTFTRFNDLQLAEAHALQAEQDLMEIKAARQKAEDTLRELKATQAQLIVSEKMASLGELTAGIAHEIQNPLNFVNNFAEINTELVDELNSELEKGNMEEAMFLATDLKDNNQKIVFHGKRAESIVKGMLQHSRASTGKKELADINALADEFLRLSYHGLRAKDKAFNAILETHFDSSIAKINVSPQDVGRVLLNLFNNAFYAVNEKKKLLISTYEPIVQVTTAKSPNYVEIRVRDNGTGIPEKVLDKIYQPFFTTKPTGEGTGLGLSLSYDIITKGHGGQMKVKTKEGEGSEFVIQLPFDNPTA